jgi:hypothetical protein
MHIIQGPFFLAGRVSGTHDLQAGLLNHTQSQHMPDGVTGDPGSFFLQGLQPGKSEYFFC